MNAEEEDEFVEWCQNRFLEIVDSTGKGKDEDGDWEGRDGDVEEKEKGIGLGAALKFVNQGIEPRKPAQTGNTVRQGR